MLVVQTSAHPFQPSSPPLGIPAKQKILRVAPGQRSIRANQAGTFRISRRKRLAGPALSSQPKNDWEPPVIVLRRGLGAKTVFPSYYAQNARFRF